MTHNEEQAYQHNPPNGLAEIEGNLAHYQEQRSERECAPVVYTQRHTPAPLCVTIVMTATGSAPRRR